MKPSDLDGSIPVGDEQDDTTTKPTTKATAHTPGPWWLDDDGCIAAGREDEYRTLLDLAGSNITDADAVLIAATPDLLAALKSLQAEIRQATRLDVRKHYSLMVADAEASKAIAKATIV